ncbi:Rpn family recombination-promoting nuclease/putative transposase [uncultured Holdemanella sp.]|uniref:Rpn family recombination-promoting nuclease/putative transposase n=1 Tax=uncultured Holdemanella sp. TaxID=1763549 RepID=UPI0025E70F6F|nr:Rpn family recombination-promoting nuclease/putative transposase [uncultured Holdemanella sp.]
MRSANLLNDFAFKYVFGEDCKEANDALKSLLTVFLERKVNHVVVKNSEIVKDYSKMKSPRLDLLVEFDDQTTVDLEMQLRQTKDNLPIRFSYYLARLHGSQDMEGKSYGQLKETIVMIFFNVSIFENDNICNTFRLKCDGDLPFVKEEKEDRMKLRTIEMPKVDLNKSLEDMNEQEKMIYYFLNCHKGMEDSKIKVMIENDEVIQMLEKRVETISDDRWKKIIEDFQKLHENEERIELQLELEEAQRQMKEARKEKEEARKEKEEAYKEKEEARKEKEEARKEIEEARKTKQDANKQLEEMVHKMYEDGLGLEQISAYCSLNVDEIEVLIKS